jgi:hypothetical protein
MTKIVKLLDWGEDGFASETETATLRASFKQEVAVWHELNHPNVTKVNISAYYVLEQSCTLMYLLCNVYSGARTVMSWWLGAVFTLYSNSFFLCGPLT